MGATVSTQGGINTAHGGNGQPADPLVKLVPNCKPVAAKFKLCGAPPADAGNKSKSNALKEISTVSPA